MEPPAPTPEQIQARAAAIRETWSPETRWARSGGRDGTPPQGHEWQPPHVSNRQLREALRG